MSTPPIATQNHLLVTGKRIRCRNLIVHANGRLYGDVAGLTCNEWVMQEGRIHFLDVLGRVRFIFEQADGVWQYTAPKNRSHVDWIRRDALLLQGRGLVTLATPSADYRLLAQRLPPGRRHFEIVVAKFKEDMAWTDSLSDNVTIYSKDVADQGKYPVLPNLGREGGTYFHHIVSRYDDLAERTLFLQGDPFPHRLLSFADYATDAAPFTTGKMEHSKIEVPIPWSSPTQRIDEAVMVDFLRLLECDSGLKTYEWVQGAQFAVSRDQIRRRPRSYYQRMLEVTQQKTVPLARRSFDNHHVAWLFELFWRYIFTDARVG